MSSGWDGKWARHHDGREGKVRSFEGFGHIALTMLDPVTKQDLGYVQLNSFGHDSGDTGWSWWCPDFSSGAAWLSLGDHNGPIKDPVYDSPPKGWVAEEERSALSEVQASVASTVKPVRRSRTS